MREYPIFSNIKQHILSLLRESKRSIIIAVAWFTDIDIIRLLEEKSQEGVSISILIDDNSNNNILLFKRLYENGVRIKLYSKGKLMHNKFCIIDGRIVISGSYNWTYNAHINNKENIIVLVREPNKLEDINIINKYKDEFESLFSRSQNLVYEIPIAGFNKLLYKGNNIWEDSQGINYQKNFNNISIISCPKNIDYVTIWSFVTEISDCAFANCVNLKSITIPLTVKKIGAYAFRGCSSLYKIDLPESIDIIKRACFRA